MFSAASLLTGPRSQQLNPNGYSAWIGQKQNNSVVANAVDANLLFLPRDSEEAVGLDPCHTC